LHKIIGDSANTDMKILGLVLFAGVSLSTCIDQWEDQQICS